VTTEETEQASAPGTEIEAELETAEEETKEPTLEEQLAASRIELEESKDQHLRALANMENFRKRTQREKEDLAKFCNEKILREFIPVLDNLERGVEHARSDSGTENLLQGIEMTIAQFIKALEQFKVTPFSSIGVPFDPSRHEAMGQIETEEHEPNTVVTEMQKGYLLHERLLRPAMVMIAKQPACAPADDDSTDNSDK